jgi:hypothetical protein
MTRRWLAGASCIALLASASVVALLDGLLPIRPAGRSREALEAFASPGEFLWWSTLGGPFSGFPSGLTGHLVWMLGTAAFWLIVAVVVRIVLDGWRSSG